MKKPILKYFDKYIIENSKEVSPSKFNEYMEGHNNKSFVLCESEIFRELFDEIKNNPDCSYRTYLNDFIKENYDGEEIPINKVSCLKKIGENNIIEELVTKLANTMGLPTVFVKNPIDNSKDAFRKRLDQLIAQGVPGTSLEYTPLEYLLSVDFISKNEYFDTIDAYCEKKEENKRVCERASSLSAWFGVFDNKKFINPITKMELTHEEKISLFREFIPQYFFRFAIIRDWDFMSENVGIIFNSDTGKYSIAPMFDFEFAYYRMHSKEMYERLIEDLIFGYDCFPEETSKIINKFVEFDINKFLDNLSLECVTTSRTKSLNNTLVKSAYEDFLLALKEYQNLPSDEL